MSVVSTGTPSPLEAALEKMGDILMRKKEQSQQIIISQQIQKLQGLLNGDIKEEPQYGQQ